MFLIKGAACSAQIWERSMSDTNEGARSRRVTALRRGKALMAGVAGLALITAAIGDELIVPVPAFAAAVPAATETLTTPPSFADIIQKVTPAVVSVKVREKQAARIMSSDNDNMQELAPFERFFFKQFGNASPNNQSSGAVRAEGSGFFVSSDGYVVTNNHVVDHAAKVDIVTNDGKTLTAKIVGVDPPTDLALLKVQGANFPYVQFARQEPRVGDWVIAMGNPFGLGETATAGIVSAHGRDIGEGSYDNFLQIDAPVNRGNSGGPTFNAQGEVVGVNTAIYSPSGGSVGIGFAIPADIVTSIYSELKDKGHVTRGAIGVRIQPVTQEIASALGMTDAHGALVDRAEPDGPASKAGIAPGDVITAIDGKTVTDAHEPARRISMMHPGAKVSLTFLHNGNSKTAEIALATLPNSAIAQTDSDDSGLPHLGMALAPSSDVPGATSSGVVVTQVAPDSVASDHGIKAGDVILDVNGKKVMTPMDVQGALRSAKTDHKSAALMRLQSGDQTRFVAVPVA
jgi:serine protease Do